MSDASVIRTVNLDLGNAAEQNMVAINAAHIRLLDVKDFITACAPWLKAQVAEAVAAEGFGVFELPSGAGHDGMAMIDVADVAMLFVRCRGGISHHPDEHVELVDADAGARVLLRLVENFRPPDLT